MAKQKQKKSRGKLNVWKERKQSLKDQGIWYISLLL